VGGTDSLPLPPTIVRQGIRAPGSGVILPMSTSMTPSPPRHWRQRAVWLLGWASGLYLLGLGVLWFGQERLLFHPEPLPADHRFRLGEDVHETWVEVPGARLNALHLRLPHPDGVVFFLHGNAGNLQSWFINPEFYRQLNLDLFMIDYRGYGKSSGRIESEAQLMADARAAWHAIAPRYAGKKRIVYGRSLGSGLAARLAAEVQPDLTVLVSPYESMQALAAEHYPWVPSFVLRYPLRTDLALPGIRGPLLLAHGALDTLIPVQHSQRLKAIAPHAELLIVPAAGHGDIHQFQACLDVLRRAYAPSLVPKILSPASPKPGMM
jgi:pimeloyl-ACP methyl ester carboxylesterase